MAAIDLHEDGEGSADVAASLRLRLLADLASIRARCLTNGLPSLSEFIRGEGNAGDVEDVEDVGGVGDVVDFVDAVDVVDLGGHAGPDGSSRESAASLSRSASLIPCDLTSFVYRTLVWRKGSVV